MAKPSLKASPQGAQVARQALLRAGLTQQELRSRVGCSRQPLTNFFKGDAIAQTLFIRICEHLNLNWREIADLPPSPLEFEAPSQENSTADLGLTQLNRETGTALPHQPPSNATGRLTKIDLGTAPNLTTFYGRKAELESLTQAILQQHTALVVLLGLRGMGKTTLAIKLVESIKQKFDYVIWRSLAHPTPPPLIHLLTDLLQYFSNRDIDSLPQTVDDLTSQLLADLRQNRCLLVLDNAESLMQDHALAGAYRPGYENYRELFRRIGTERHQSCLILTTREIPREIAELEARDFPVSLLSVMGLAVNDAKQLLASKGLGDQAYWNTLIEIFQGNPLALQIVAATIQRSFGGQVSLFLKQATITTRQIVDLLDQQFDSLSPLEREIMYWLAVQPQPLAFAELKELIEVSGADLLDALESLLRRSLIQGEAAFTLQPVVRQYVMNEFEQQQLSLELAQVRNSIQHLLVQNNRAAPATEQ